MDFLDAEGEEDDPVPNETETDRDEALRLAALPGKQLHQFQKAAQDAEAKDLEQAAALQQASDKAADAALPAATAPANGELGKGARGEGDHSDLHLEFEAGEKQLPAMSGEPTARNVEKASRTLRRSAVGRPATSSQLSRGRGATVLHPQSRRRRDMDGLLERPSPCHHVCSHGPIQIQ